MDQLDIARALLNVSASKHSLLGGDHDFRRECGHLAKQPRVVDEARNVAGHKAVHHAAHTDDFTGEDARVDRGFRVIPDNAA